MDKTFFGVVFTGGLFAGTLDISAAIILLSLRGSAPLQVLQSVASGLLGMEAYQSRLSGFLGLLLHFFIATSASFVYCFARINLSKLPLPAIVCGLIYGILVYAFMNFIVLPLSAFPHQIHYTLRGLLVIMFCVGLPIALTAERLSPAAIPDRKSRMARYN